MEVPVHNPHKGRLETIAVAYGSENTTGLPAGRIVRLYP